MHGFIYSLKNHKPFIPLHDPGNLDADPYSNKVNSDLILIW